MLAVLLLNIRLSQGAINRGGGGGVFNQIKVLKKGLGIVSAEIV
jgi:hypothetical protein